MEKYNIKKSTQLGINVGTASNRLKKLIMFDLLKRLNQTKCHRCGKEINTVDELSVEHIEPWLDTENPYEKFFDLNNISFSHLFCNISSAKRKRAECGTYNKYISGCKCEKCRAANALKIKKGRDKKKNNLLV